MGGGGTGYDHPGGSDPVVPNRDLVVVVEDILDDVNPNDICAVRQRGGGGVCAVEGERLGSGAYQLRVWDYSVGDGGETGGGHRMIGERRGGGLRQRRTRPVACPICAYLVEGLVGA